jgi:hypothetical protein
VAGDAMVQDSPVSHADLLTAEDVVERLSADPALRRLAAHCVLSAVPTSDGWRFRRSDLDAWIERSQRPGTPEGRR